MSLRLTKDRTQNHRRFSIRPCQFLIRDQKKRRRLKQNETSWCFDYFWVVIRSVSSGSLRETLGWPSMTYDWKDCPSQNRCLVNCPGLRTSRPLQIHFLSLPCFYQNKRYSWMSVNVNRSFRHDVIVCLVSVWQWKSYYVEVIENFLCSLNQKPLRLQEKTLDFVIFLGKIYFQISNLNQNNFWLVRGKWVRV